MNKCKKERNHKNQMKNMKKNFMMNLKIMIEFKNKDLKQVVILGEGKDNKLKINSLKGMKYQMLILKRKTNRMQTNNKKNKVTSIKNSFWSKIMNRYKKSL